MEGIADSCLEVPCRFNIPIKEEANIVNCSGGVVWQKGRLGGPAVFNAQHPHANAIQGELVGDPTKKNCSTTFHNFPKNQSGIFFFRLNCLNHVKYNFHEGVVIDIQAEPPPPPADLCGSGVGGRPGEAAVSGPGALLHPAPLHHLAAPRPLQAGADTDAAESGRPEDDDLHVDLCRLSRASQPERLVLRVLPADQRGEQPPPPRPPTPSPSCTVPE
ncbi:uncharacterized protein LOC120827000 isoform X3 [Gasterosteus aculeatus]